MATSETRLTILIGLALTASGQASFAAAPLACVDLFQSTRAPALPAYLEAQLAMYLEAKRSHKSAPALLRELSISSATRNALLNDILYKYGFVEASGFSRLMSDKLFQVEFLGRANPALKAYFPKTMAFSQFLNSHRILEDRDVASRLKRSLAQEFPNGFVVKPTAGYNTEGRGFYINDLDGLTEDLRQNPAKFIGDGKPFVSPELGVASGEPFLIQEMLSPPGGGRPPEYRVHTFEGRVVKGATESRWLDPGERNFLLINAYVQSFLDQIPPGIVRHQAWGLDVVESSPGKYRIIEINTNRGQPIQWSGYLISSLQLGALVRHLEAFGYLHLTGPAAMTFRQNKAGIEAWIRKEGLEQVIKDLKINDPELADEIEKQYRP